MLSGCSELGLLVAYWIIVFNSSQPCGARHPVQYLSWGVGIWQLMYIAFSVIFVLVRNRAEHKSKWKVFLLSKEDIPFPPQRSILFQFFYFILPISFWQPVYGDISCQDESHLSIACSALSVPFKEFSALWVSRNNEPHSFLQLSVKTYFIFFFFFLWNKIRCF